MDIAHELAASGARAGVLVVADRQDSGRGRGGNTWASADNAGVWMTLIERPRDQHAVRVLALRLGMVMADVLTPMVDEPIMLKWPNDVFAGAGKLAGILVEARWRDGDIEWVAIGIGINRRAPEGLAQAAAVRAGISRAEILRAVVPAIRGATAMQGYLTDDELARWHARDVARGKRLSQPRMGLADGIECDGALRVLSLDRSTIERVHTGSLAFAP